MKLQRLVGETVGVMTIKEIGVIRYTSIVGSGKEFLAIESEQGGSGSLKSEEDWDGILNIVLSTVKAIEKMETFKDSVPYFDGNGAIRVDPLRTEFWSKALEKKLSDPNAHAMQRDRPENELFKNGVKSRKTGYMCYIDYVDELGNNSRGNTVYPNASFPNASFSNDSSHRDCGVVEVEVSLKRLLLAPTFDKKDKTRSTKE